MRIFLALVLATFSSTAFAADFTADYTCKTRNNIGIFPAYYNLTIENESVWLQNPTDVFHTLVQDKNFVPGTDQPNTLRFTPVNPNDSLGASLDAAAKFEVFTSAGLLDGNEQVMLQIRGKLRNLITGALYMCIRDEE